MQRFLIMLFLCAPLTGCYYMQAASGQWEVMRKREPLSDVIEDTKTGPELANRLRLLSEARDFSITVLGLPDNRSYRSYSDLKRDYVVWNVFAAPEFSLQAKQWCFPVAGCVSYRGYFSRDAAVKESKRLAAEGFDVVVGGVAAYSTLGNFSDPILSTMMRWDDTELIAVLFHELAHQVVYVKDDSSFNESFATAVEEIGVSLWLESRGEMAKMTDYVAGRELQQSLLKLMETARSDLGSVYESNIDVEMMRDQKRERLKTLAEDVAARIARSGGDNSVWLSREMNNARLISMGLYEG
ncbi:MAG: aminopeptidase, partial [Woeseiaceae bacterium]|nr:aminopeptidase [Woeseiaceae bacterium]